MEDEKMTKTQLINELKKTRQRIAELGKSEIELKHTMEAIRQRSEFEKIVSTISSRFVTTSDFNEAVTTSLADIGKLSGASRACLFLFGEDETTMDNTHEWCAEGVSPQIDNLQNLPCDMFPWWMTMLRKGEIIHIKDVSRMPVAANAEKETLESQDIKSLLVLPLYARDKLAGCIGFDNVIRTGEWKDIDIAILRICSEILGSTFEHKQIEKELRKHRDHLEELVEERTHALQESETLHRTLVETLQEGLGIVDPNENIVFANPAFCNILGYSNEEITRMNLREFVSEEDFQKLVQETAQRKKGVSGQYDLIMKRKDGELRCINLSASPRMNNKGQFQGVIGVILDVTEQKQAEEELKEREMFNYALFEYNPMATMVVDLEGKITGFNLAIRDSGDRLPNIGDVMFKGYTGKHEIDMHAEMIESMTSGKIKHFPEQRYGDKILSITISPFSKGAVIIFQDITESRQAEKALKSSLREKEVLLREIHHRVKNNMQVVSSLLRLQSTYIDDKRVSKMFQDSQNRIKSMALVHERLYKSKDLARIDFTEYIMDLANQLFTSYGVNRERIKLNIDVRDISLDISMAIPCGLIVNELILNAIEHAFPENKEGKIEVTFHLDKKNRCTLAVKDDGIGFPEDLDFRTTKTLGLQLVNTLVEQLNGTIELGRRRGTSFIITFTI